MTKGSNLVTKDGIRSMFIPISARMIPDGIPHRNAATNSQFHSAPPLFPIWLVSEVLCKRWRRSIVDHNRIRSRVSDLDPP